MRQRRVLALDALELGDPLGGAPRLEQREAVVQALARRARRQRQRLAQLLHRLRLGGGVLVERLAEVAMLPQRLGGVRAGAAGWHWGRRRLGGIG